MLSRLSGEASRVAHEACNRLAELRDSSSSDRTSSITLGDFRVLRSASSLVAGEQRHRFASMLLRADRQANGRLSSTSVDQRSISDCGRRMMPKALTSWKEIAQYLGKGVRTVQRWEHYFGLPVRRPSADSHHAVLALPAELDAWLIERTRTRRGRSPISEIEELRRKIAGFEEENRALRLRLAMLDASKEDLHDTADSLGTPSLTASQRLAS